MFYGRNKSSKSNKKMFLIIILLLLFGVGFGVCYAYYSTDLSYNGTTSIHKSSWDVHLDNLVISNGSYDVVKDATLNEAKTSIEYSIDFNKKNQFYEFSFDIINNGEIDAKLSNFTNDVIPDAYKNIMNYSVKYADGSNITIGDVISSGDKKRVVVRISINNGVTNDVLPTEKVYLDLRFNSNFVEAD